MARLTAALVLAAVAAAALDRFAAWRGLDPPGFRDPRRRLLAGMVLGFIFFFGIFLPALTFDLPQDLNLGSVGTLKIFAFQLLLLGALVLWVALGFVAVPGVGARRSATAWAGGVVTGVLVLGLLILHVTETSDFLYFQF